MVNGASPEAHLNSSSTARSRWQQRQRQINRGSRNRQGSMLRRRVATTVIIRSSTTAAMAEAVQTLTATIDPHQQQTAANNDKLMVLQGSWFAGYRGSVDWFPWEEHAHWNDELKQGKTVERSNGDQSTRKRVMSRRSMLIWWWWSRERERSSGRRWWFYA